MWAFVTSLCTIRYFNPSGINDPHVTGDSASETICTSWFFLFQNSKFKKKKRINGNTAGCSQVLGVEGQ